MTDHMKWDTLVGLERRKSVRSKVKDSVSRSFFLMTFFLLLFLAFGDSVGTSPLWHQVDKGMHFMVFGSFTLVFLQYARFKILNRWQSWIRLLVLFGVLTSLAVIAEISHKFVPGRTYELTDMAANLAGIFFFGLPFIIIVPFQVERDCFSSAPLSGESMSRGEQASPLRIRQRPGRKSP
ncbi:MAG: VanZ family protein [Verrucomicrobiota bacterium]|nr:VanZ family protein [Verrucomicrobiota bacterium]